MTDEQIDRRFFGVCAIVWMAIIFSFSSQNALESSAMSGGIVDTIVNFIVQFAHDLSDTQVVQLKDFLEIFIRKSAHALNYLILAILIYKAQVSTKNTIKKSLWAGGTALMYAITDEYHQLFVPGRSCELRDVFVDFGGILVGMAIVLMIQKQIIKK
ncbi:MAG: VanZ family protein [Eubacterium sp.]